MARVLGILGSPRRGGNSELLLDEALTGASGAGAETRKLVLSELNIAGCTECNDCYQTGECSTYDGMSTVYQALEWADRILLVSPIFFMGLPSQAKAMVDRTQCYWALKYVLNQPFPRAVDAPGRYGAFIGVGGTKGPHLFDGAVLTVKYFFDAISVEPREELYVFVRGVDEKGEIADRAEELRAAREAGEALAELD
jgi:multimeric flavodoxin WrbA